MRKKVIKRMCFDAIFASISLILYVFGPKFPLPFIFPGFLDIQFSMLPILIITFMLGPIDGLIVILVRFFVKVFAFSSFTSPYGEISDLIYSIVVVLVVSLVYSKLKKQENVSSKRRFVTLLISIVGSWVVGGLLSNSFSIPIYCLIMGKETVYNMVAIFPFVNESNWVLYYFTLAVIPFNLLLSSIVGVLTLLVDKHLLNFYNRI
ncbi:MAG: ECF transporter S component [Erysipelotrichaceae bacterium]|nr:ECF transporter S component [Erysipelotrichaceae bacterium]